MNFTVYENALKKVLHNTEIPLKLRGAMVDTAYLADIHMGTMIKACLEVQEDFKNYALDIQKSGHNVGLSPSRSNALVVVTETRVELEAVVEALRMLIRATLGISDVEDFDDAVALELQAGLQEETAPRPQLYAVKR